MFSKPRDGVVTLVVKYKDYRVSARISKIRAASTLHDLCFKCAIRNYERAMMRNAMLYFVLHVFSSVSEFFLSVCVLFCLFICEWPVWTTRLRCDRNSPRVFFVRSTVLSFRPIHTLQIFEFICRCVPYLLSVRDSFCVFFVLVAAIEGLDTWYLHVKYFACGSCPESRRVSC